MAFNLNFLLIFSLIFLIPGSVSRGPILPKFAILPVSKDLKVLQYVAKLSVGENPAPVQLVVNLNGPLVWVDCESNSVFSSRQPIETQSLHCSMAKSSNPCFRGGGGTGYKSKICILQAENRISRISTSGELNEDSIGMEFWDGINSISFAKKDDFLFSCAPNLLLNGLAIEAKGMLGLGNSRISLPSQFSTTFNFFQRRFSLCLSPSNGAIFLGGNPFENDHISGSMMYTPLISKKSGLQEGSYYINLNSIKISGKKLSLLNKKGLQLAKVSTVVPYTTFQTKIYQTLVEAYMKAAISMNLTKVSPLAPFEVCFSSKGVEEKWVGPNVPIIDLILQSEMVKWRIHGRNSMVAVSDDVMCLGFLDGGLSPVDSIVVGGYQLEDYLLEFNLGSSMLGFSQSLLVEHKQCSDFKMSDLYRKTF